MSETKYYTSRGRMLHSAVNIALAPVLLYLFRYWNWPPDWSHLPWFLASSGVAAFFVVQRRRTPKFIIGETTISAGNRTWRQDQLVAIQPVLRQLRVVVDEDGSRRESVIAMGWASAQDYREIATRLAAMTASPDDA